MNIHIIDFLYKIYLFKFKGKRVMYTVYVDFNSELHAYPVIYVMTCDGVHG